MITINLSSFTTLLTILFIGLKLGNVIDWSWWWVLSPIWIPLAVLLIVVVFMWLLIIVNIKKIAKRRKNVW